MKKRIFLLLITIGLLAAGCGKDETIEVQKIPQAESSETLDEVREEELPQVETEVEVEESVDTQAFGFKDLEDHQFYFSSGAGGWRTFLNIDADGRFDGAYSDSEMGSVGEDYPNGTYYLCEFIGKFSNLVLFKCCAPIVFKKKSITSEDVKDANSRPSFSFSKTFNIHPL